MSKVEIPKNDLIVQILARLDGHSYNQALSQDANSINNNFLASSSFPWQSKARLPLPQKLVKTMPRDIDDLDVITHCQDELRAPFGDFKGPFGYGRYENGQARGNYSADVDAPQPTAAARRSHDPGVLELGALLPLPSSLDEVTNGKGSYAVTTPADQWEAVLTQDSAMLSHLPYRWEKKDRGLTREEPSGQMLGNEVQKYPNVDNNAENSSDFDLQKLTDSRARSRAQIDIATSCVRKWKISMKVGGVSSRSTLFPSSFVIATKGNGIPENSRKVIRPMLSFASLPIGQTVPTAKAKQMDKAGFADRLGSYDCRYTNALMNPKKEASNKKSKQIEVGRTRLVWSNLIQGDEPYLPSTRNRVNFNSLITGQRLDLSKCKRPKTVKVGVRLNGRIITEEAIEDLPATASARKKRKISTRAADNEGSPLLMRVQCPESRTIDEIDTALHRHSIGQTSEERALNRSTANGSIVYLELGDQSISHPPDIDKSDVIATLLKFNQKKLSQKKPKRSASSDAIPTTGGSHFIKQSTSPRFACVPLEDGLARTVCLNAGNMSGAVVHQVIREVAEQSGKKCSVCWSDEGSGKEGVQECVQCGLLAHSSCCLDNGTFSIPSGGSSKSSQDTAHQHQVGHVNGNSKDPIACDSDDQVVEEWQCAVCCRYTEIKPRRQPKMPARYTDGDQPLNNTTVDNDVVNRHANMPGPRCYLCPHRGGAMSQDSRQSPPDSSTNWAHEICRVWSSRDNTDDSQLKESPSFSQHFPNGSPLSNVCALCGTGGVRCNDASIMQINSGLTRCAARGCLVTFHSMCALLATKVGTAEDKSGGGKAKSVRTRKTRHSDQISEEKKSDDDNEQVIEADRKLCKEYTLQLVQLTHMDTASGEEKKTTIPVAFCGIHNPRRDDAVYGCLPGGTAI